MTSQTTNSIACFALLFVLLLSVNACAGEESTGPRSNYFPRTESLGLEEMRVTALGTGTPDFRRSQASASWLVELGNGEKFIFDIGTGSLANLAALKIPYTYLDKIFISHLHVDHIGDLDAMFIGGWVSNRTVPLRNWGAHPIEAKEPNYRIGSKPAVLIFWTDRSGGAVPFPFNPTVTRDTIRL